MIEYLWSDNEEEWGHPETFPTREAALAEARAYGLEPEATIWTGRKRTFHEWLDHQKPNHYAIDVLERVEEGFGFDSGAEEAVVLTTQEQEEALGRAIIAAIKEHTTCTRFAIVDVEQHTLEEDE